MKKFVFILFLIYFANVTVVFAHPGNTASDGGHFCESNCYEYGLQDGERHLHIDGQSVRDYGYYEELEREKELEEGYEEWKDGIEDCQPVSDGMGNAYNPCDKQSDDGNISEGKMIKWLIIGFITLNIIGLISMYIKDRK